MRKNHSPKCFRIQKPHFSFLLFSGFPNQNIPEDHNSNPNKLLVTCTVTLKKIQNLNTIPALKLYEKKMFRDRMAIS